MTATACIQPIDMVKVRIQLLSEGKAVVPGPITVVKEMLANGQGVKQFYKGLDSALLRQATYGTARLGLYRTFANKVTESNIAKGKAESLSFFQKAGCGLIAGALACVIGNPCDLALVRFQADGILPAEQRRNYKHVGDALSRIVKEEGFFALWKGIKPTIARAMAMNMGQLAPYDQAKEMLKHQLGETKMVNILASCIAGFTAAFCSLPFDNVKTKLQKQTGNEYSGFFDCMKKTLQRERLVGFWAGFSTYYIRVAPHSVICLLCIDVLNHFAAHL